MMKYLVLSFFILNSAFAMKPMPPVAAKAEPQTLKFFMSEAIRVLREQQDRIQNSKEKLDALLTRSLLAKNAEAKLKVQGEYEIASLDTINHHEYRLLEKTARVVGNLEALNRRSVEMDTQIKNIRIRFEYLVKAYEAALGKTHYPDLVKNYKVFLELEAVCKTFEKELEHFDRELLKL